MKMIILTGLHKIVDYSVNVRQWHWKVWLSSLFMFVFSWKKVNPSVLQRHL